MTFYFSAPYALPEGNARAAWYGFSATPSVMFDGVIAEVGGLPSGSMYPTYANDFNARAPIASPLVMNGGYSIIGNQGSATFTITVDQPVSGSNTVHFFICQEGLHDQSNMVVDIPPTESFTLTNVGESTTVATTFTMDPSWTEADLRVIALVQNNSTKEILQACLAGADYNGTVLVDCVPNGMEAGWTLQGPSGFSLSGRGDASVPIFEPGEFTMTWEDLTWWTSPPTNPQTLTLVQDGTITFTGQYYGGPFGADSSLPLGDAGDGCAVSLVDVDEDGDLDVHLVNNGSADRLLVNDGSGGWTDVAAGQVADTGAGRGCAWADFNGDGHLDVYLVKENEANVLLDGDGTGGFTVDPAYGIGDTGPGFAAAWVDYERDGDLDLYIVEHGAANVLLQNLGDLGVGYMIFQPDNAPNGLGNGTAVALTDGDLDGYLDIYVPNQYNPNVFLQDTDLGYNDVSATSGLDDINNGTGAAWGDYDNDGDFDLYLVNDGNADKLYRCTGSFQYSLVNDPVVQDPGHGRGAAWVDVDNDGWLDLYVARNGQSDLLLINDQAGGFFRVMVGADQSLGAGNGVVCGDLDGDHRPDIVVSCATGANFMLRNTRATGNNWLDLELTGAGSNTSALGARVTVTAGGMTQTRLLAAGTGYMTNAPLRQHFGLGSATVVDQVAILWPDGTNQTFGPVGANLELAVVQGQDPVSGVADGVPAATRLEGNYPNPFNPRTTIAYELAADGPVQLEVYGLDGRRVATLTDGVQTAGRHRIEWRGVDDRGQAVASGAYLYRLRTTDGVLTGRMSLVK